MGNANETIKQKIASTRKNKKTKIKTIPSSYRPAGVYIYVHTYTLYVYTHASSDLVYKRNRIKQK